MLIIILIYKLKFSTECTIADIVYEIKVGPTEIITPVVEYKILLFGKKFCSNSSLDSRSIDFCFKGSMISRTNRAYVKCY